VKSKTKRAAKTSTETGQEVFEKILKLRGALKDDSSLRFLRESGNASVSGLSAGYVSSGPLGSLQLQRPIMDILLTMLRTCVEYGRSRT
jgi:hypothetical protein